MTFLLHNQSHETVSRRDAESPRRALCVSAALREMQLPLPYRQMRTRTPSSAFTWLAVSSLAELPSLILKLT